MNYEFLDPAVQVLETVPPWQATLLVIGLSVGVALLLEVVVMRGLLRYSSRTETAYDNILVSEFRLPIVLTGGLAGVFLLTQVPSVAESVLLSPAQLDTFFGKPSLTVIVLAWAHAANRSVNRFVAEVKDEGSRFDFAPVLSNVWTLVVLVGTAGTLLSVWEYSVAPLLGAAGIAGIAVGFAARDTVANFFGGIALYFDDTYKLGDYIELDSGEAGTVVKVGVRSTTLLTRDEVLIVVPNSVLNSAMVINQSAPGRRRRLKLPIGVAYGTDLDEFERLALAAAAAEPLVLESPQPRMRLRRFGDSALEYELLCWVGSPVGVNKARHLLNREIYARVNDAGVEIPYPHRELIVRTAGPDDVGTALDPSDGAPAPDARPSDSSGASGASDADRSAAGVPNAERPA